jgi:hypothetical protein
MGKKENHANDLSPLLDAYAETGDAEDLAGYLLTNSDLPGRRANLELGYAFGDVITERATNEAEGLWELCTTLVAVSAEAAPINTRQEFLPFCGAVGVGAIGSVWPELFDEALAVLRSASHDARWRMREAVCFGLQRLLVDHGRDTLQALDAWVAKGDCLEMRAAAAAVAEPALLDDAEMARYALALHKSVFDQVLAANERKSEAFKTLRKALGYTLSVVTQALPEQGFEYLAWLAQLPDPDVQWIVKQNLKKNRLIKYFPQQVENTKRLLGG